LSRTSALDQTKFAAITVFDAHDYGSTFCRSDRDCRQNLGRLCRFFGTSCSIEITNGELPAASR
jgi:hypothetical protein